MRSPVNDVQQEQEIEIEKYVDLAYSRDEEAPTPWPFRNLTSLQSSEQFYPANEFHLYKYVPARDSRFVDPVPWAQQPWPSCTYGLPFRVQASSACVRGLPACVQQLL
jgi:hypothetical protein